jgi:radical SAM protein with 4Fe4S-binding SPASM domain
MCNIWRSKIADSLKPADYLKLPKSLNDINITGGEPFLRDDLLEILDSIFKRCNPERLVISSNGFLTDRIVGLAKIILKRSYADRVIIALSLDALGKKHNEIRGVVNAFELVINTITELKRIGFNNIGLGFTFISGNEDQYLPVYEFAKKNNLNFGATIAHNAENYFSTDNNEKPDYKIIKKQTDYYIGEKIESFKKNELGKCYYMHGLAYYARTGKALVNCDAMRGSFFIDPRGNIYPCNILTDIAGNLLEADFKNIWQSRAADKIRCKTKNCPTACWMVCTAKPGIKKHWLKTGLWLIKRKLKQ